MEKDQEKEGKLPDLQVLLQGTGEGILGHGTDDGVNLFAVLVDHQSGDAHDALGHGGALVLVCVELAKGDVTHFARQFFDDWANALAGTAPGGPEVHEDNSVFLGERFKVGVRQGCDTAHRDASATESEKRFGSSDPAPCSFSLGWCERFKANYRLGGLLALQYLSQEWAEAVLAKIESDPKITAALDGVKISILAIVLGSPEGRYGFLYVAFDGTGLSEYRVGYDYDAVTKGLESPSFVVSGPYEVFASVVRGEISERKALMTGKLHLTGGLLKALRHMGAMEAVTAVLNSVECET